MNIIEGKKYICEEFFAGKGLFGKERSRRDYVHFRFVYQNGNANPPTHIRWNNVNFDFPITEFKFNKIYTFKWAERKMRFLEE